MAAVRIPYDALVLVGDGEKALFLRNKGDGQHPNLVLEHMLEGQSVERAGGRTPKDVVPDHMIEDDGWENHRREEFAREIARTLYGAALARRYDKLVVVAPPRVLGDLRREFHKEVSSRVVAEVDKTLTNRDLGDIERVLAKL